MKLLLKLTVLASLITALSACAASSKSPAASSDTTAGDATATSDAKAASAAKSPSPGDADYKRKQYKGNTTFEVSETATKDAKFKTPLPEEFIDASAYLPDGMIFRLPFDRPLKVTAGYGFESKSWTHQTIGNTESANDFFAIDLGAEIGTPVLAPARGRVLTSQDRTSQDSYGNYIVIDHGQGIHTIYAHMSKREFEVDHGSPEIWVEAGQKIGETGKSGTRWPHLHFGIHKDSRISQSGCDVGGAAVVPEPLGGYCGIRSGHVLDPGK